MSDLISRQELREWVANWFEKNRHYHPYSKSNNIPITELYDILEHLPTIDPVKHGEWIVDDFGFHCSECWTRYPSEITDELNYCPNCGARMETDE